VRGRAAFVISIHRGSAIREDEAVQEDDETSAGADREHNGQWSIRDVGVEKSRIPRASGE
jgi:hypothetical protein